MAIKFSSNVAQSVLKARNLDGQASVDDLVKAAESHNVRSTGYLSRDELEMAASALAKTLGVVPGAESLEGSTYLRKFVDQAKAGLVERGLFVTDDALLDVARQIDNGNGRLSRAELTKAADIIAELVVLDELDSVATPARPGVAAQAPDAEAGFDRRKLADTFQHAGGDVKVAFFDADSTLRVSQSGSVSANNATDVMLLPFVGERIRELTEQGYMIAVVSNQAGVANGYVSKADADAALQLTADLVRKAGGEVHYTDFAEARDNNRKPNTGMADRLDALLQSHFGSKIDRAGSMMVGDSAYKRSDTRPDGSMGTNFSNSDRKFAKNAGIPFVEPQAAFRWGDYGVPQFDNRTQLDAFKARFKVTVKKTQSPWATRLGG